MKTTELRQKFLQFFQSKGHTAVRSSSLIPQAFARTLQQVQAELDLPITTVDLFQEPDKAAKSAQHPSHDKTDTATKMPA